MKTRCVRVWSFAPFRLVTKVCQLGRSATARSVKVLSVLVFVGTLAGADTLITFEQFTDGEQLTNQIPGVLFSNTEVATAGISLNEFEFPPHSGKNVAFDNGGPITITFSSPISLFSGYFTYSVPLTLDGFASTNNLLAFADSKFSSNLGLSGVPGSHPNEFLDISSSLGIDEVTITGSPSGESFAMDDISFQPLASHVPEPLPMALLTLGLGLVGFLYRHSSLIEK